MSVFSVNTAQRIEDLHKAHIKADNALKTGLVEELAKVVDNTHAIKVIDRYKTFINHCTNAAEAVHYVTTDGEQLFLMSGDEECFFADDDYGEIIWNDFIWVLNSHDSKLVEIEWTKMR
jgi:hypothetical protein